MDRRNRHSDIDYEYSCHRRPSAYCGEFINNNLGIRSIMEKFRVIAKDDPKDRIEVEVGDFKQPEFYNQVKIMRWDNEVNVSLDLQPYQFPSPHLRF